MKKLLIAAVIGITAVTGCRKIEMDSQTVYVPVGGGGTGTTTGQTIVISGTITKDSTLRAGNNYILSGLVFIEKGSTLTIEPGVTVKGEYSGSNVAALIIKRGAKINAKGTASAPIIFTSNAPTPKSGDWGGVVLCGTARVNAAYNNIQGLYQVEGGINDGTGRGLAGSGDALYPTPNDDDNSGVLQYVRIEYAGYAFVPDNEINSLTLAAVGRGTTIDHIQITYAKDDAIEWFGGNVNCKYLFTYKTQDDDFDTDNGYSGQVQFGLIVRDSAIADVSNSEAFESDNNSSGTTALPKTSAIFTNCTVIGPRATANNVGNSRFLAAVQIRRNSAISIYNSIFMGWGTAIIIDDQLGTATSGNIIDSSLRLKNILIAGCATPISYVGTGGSSTSAVDAWFRGQAGTLPVTAIGNDVNKIVTTVAEAGYTRPFDYTNYDFTPFGNTATPNLNFPTAAPPVTNNVSFTDSKLVAAMGTTQINKIETVTFRGAISPAATTGDFSNWYKGWTKF